MRDAQDKNWTAASVRHKTTCPMEEGAGRSPCHPALRVLRHASRITVTFLSHSLQHQRDPLTYADAHRAECVLALDAVELIQRRGCQSRSAHPQRMTDCDGTAIGIDM